MEQAIIWTKSPAFIFLFFFDLSGGRGGFFKQKKIEILENYGFSLIARHKQMELYSKLVHK